jgi:membrane-associated phospholipid phosphatase
MSMTRRPTAIAPAHKWFILATVLFALFLLYTAIFSTGALLNLTLQQEQWLLHRPLTGVDCVFRQWKRFGEVPFSLFFTCLLGIGCLLLGYRRRILPYLLLLLLLCVGIEYEGKQIFPQPIPDSIQFGLSTLTCPQMAHAPRSLELLVTLGMWWEAPLISARRIRNEHLSATTPFTLDEASDNYSYPSGHAIRWMFLGLILSWLVWRHMKHRWLRVPLLMLTLLIALGGGFALFYNGGHLATDLTAGYLVGASAACCAIGLLARNGSNKSSPGQAQGMAPTMPTMEVASQNRS